MRNYRPDNLAPVFLPDPVNRDHPLNHGRVAWWNVVPGIDGGRQWFDLMGLNHGTLTSMGNSSNGWRSQASPGGNGSVLFDGSAGYITAGTASQLAITGKIHLHCFCNVIAFPSSGNLAYLMGKGYDGSNEAYYMRLKNNSGTMVLQCGSFSGSDFFTQWNIAGWSASQWVSLDADYDGSNWRLYFNGAQVASSGAGTGAVSSTAPFLVGASSQSSVIQRFANVQINSASVWSRTLSAAEVQADYIEEIRGCPETLNRMSNRMFSIPSAASALLLMRRRRTAA